MSTVSPTSIGRGLPHGPGCVTAEIRGQTITLFTYRPFQRHSPQALLLFDGMRRDAAGIRNKAAKLCERAGMIAFAPLMDRSRFPKWRYDWAGVVRKGIPQSQAQWTGPWLQALVEWARGLVDENGSRSYLFGHSAGGQLLSRVCAYAAPVGVERIIVSNSSSYTLPLLNERIPYGYRDLVGKDDRILALQAYLALPLTVYLGQEDTGDLNLSKHEASMRQGENRLERGRYLYSIAEKAARKHGFAFNWCLVEVPGVAHSSRAMLEAAQFSAALGAEEAL